MKALVTPGDMVVYANESRGIRETSPELLEMAKVFRIPFLRRLRYLYIPNTVPYATAAVSSGLSLCWKAGIAAEIIGLSKESIGRQLYDAKLYLDTSNLFAWTVVVILVSVFMEWIVMIFLRAAAVALADPTLWYRPSQAARCILGLPLRPETSENEDAPEESADTLEKPADTVAETSEALEKPADVSEKPADAVVKATDSLAKSANILGEVADAAVETTEALEKPADASAEPSEALEKPADTVAEPDTKPVVELRGISKSYNDKPVLTDVSLKLRRGEILLITGPSGGGKTTLLRCMLGLVRPDSGAVEYPSGKPRMAAVFQEDRLCAGLPAWKNIAIALSGRTGKPAWQQILDDLAKLGIDDGARKPVRAFSGGMKRRVAWLRALSVKPELLVLDEPFTGLDTARKELLLERLQSVSQNTAIAIVTHNTPEIEKICENFSNVIRVSQGV